MDENKNIERRPIASRDKKLSKAIASWLAQIGISPNFISIAGMFCAIGAGFAFWATSKDNTTLFWVLGAILVQCRLLANMFDGMVAIQTNKASPVGELYNEVPDRISDAAILIGFGYAFSSNSTLGYLAAAAAILTAYMRAMGKVAGAHQEFCGPMAKPQRMFIITLAVLLCAFLPELWKNHFEFQNYTLPSIALIIIFVGSLLTFLIRLLRIASVLKRS